MPCEAVAHNSPGKAGTQGWDFWGRSTVTSDWTDGTEGRFMNHLPSEHRRKLIEEDDAKCVSAQRS